MSHNKLTIKSWSEDDRPREKLIFKGAKALSNAELIAILIGSGNNTQSAVDLSMEILSQCEGKLSVLSQMTVNELIKFKGIGQAKAITIMAASELAKRKTLEVQTQKPKIKSSKDAYDYMLYHLQGLNHEQFWIVLLNRSNSVIHFTQISKGGFSATVVDPKLIFSIALQWKASGMILFYNHPSGNLKPSESDKKLTQRIMKSAELLEITVLDHIIVGQNAYFSFADEHEL
jgi:DNA repair protein RadC